MQDRGKSVSSIAGYVASLLSPSNSSSWWKALLGWMQESVRCTAWSGRRAHSRCCTSSELALSHTLGSRRRNCSAIAVRRTPWPSAMPPASSSGATQRRPTGSALHGWDPKGVICCVNRGHAIRHGTWARRQLMVLLIALLVVVTRGKGGGEGGEAGGEGAPVVRYQHRESFA